MYPISPSPSTVDLVHTAATGGGSILAYIIVGGIIGAIGLSLILLARRGKV